MTERRDGADATPAPASRSAGSLLKAAREREGLQLAALAATIKVSAAKLEALEQDRHDELPNPTFVRALAQSVCRSLRIDPRPVLALLPQMDAPSLERTAGPLNTPFHDRPSRGEGSGLVWASKPMFWAGGVLLVAAVLVGLVPREWIESRSGAAVSAGAAAPASGSATARAASAEIGRPLATSSSPVPAAGVVAQLAQVASAAATVAVEAIAVAASPVSADRRPAPPAASGASAASAPNTPRGRSLQVVATAPSWVEVLDAEGQSLLSRVVQAGESLSLDGRRPLRVKVGNAAGTQLVDRGVAVDLAPGTRDNVARVELR